MVICDAILANFTHNAKRHFYFLDSSLGLDTCWIASCWIIACTLFFLAALYEFVRFVRIEKSNQRISGGREAFGRAARITSN